MASVATVNPFSILDEEVEVQSPRKAVAKKEAPKKTEKVSNDNSRAAPGERRTRNEYPSRGGFRGTPRVPDERDKRDVNFQESSSKSVRGAKRGGARGGEPRGATRRHDSDRRSASGKVDGEKKEVAGNTSWGNPIEAEIEANEEVAEIEGEVAEVEEKEPEVITKSLDEYYAEKKTASVPLPAPREANDGKVDPKWKDAVVVEKKDEFFFYKEEASKPKQKTKEKAVKQFLPIDPRLTASPRVQRKSRDEKPREEGKYTKTSAKTNVDIKDLKSFPTLGR